MCPAKQVRQMLRVRRVGLKGNQVQVHRRHLMIPIDETTVEFV